VEHLRGHGAARAAGIPAPRGRRSRPHLGARRHHGRRRYLQIHAGAAVGAAGVGADPHSGAQPSELMELPGVVEGTIRVWPTRREVMAGAGAALGLRAKPLWAAALPSASPDEEGFAPDLEARLDKALAAKRVWGLHGVVVVRDGRLVLERYFEGDDNARG